jgi:hypothetical protein
MGIFSLEAGKYDAPPTFLINRAGNLFFPYGLRKIDLLHALSIIKT